MRAEHPIFRTQFATPISPLTASVEALDQEKQVGFSSGSIPRDSNDRSEVCQLSRCISVLGQPETVAQLFAADAHFRPQADVGEWQLSGGIY